MQTQIFKSYSEFLRRADKDINGVSQSFADDHSNYVANNKYNEGCSSPYQPRSQKLRGIGGKKKYES